MQMTMDAAIRPGPMHAFALRKGSGYVMRSEKRPGYGGGGSPNRNGRKPKRPKAGILYILLTLLLCVIIWPVGLVMLWARKVRMQAGTKLLISLLTLCVSVFLIVFALTVPVDNPQFTDFQDKANDWLNRAAADVAVAGDAAYKKGVETWGVMKEFADNTVEASANTLADGLDKGVDLARKARGLIENRPESDVAIEEPTEVEIDIPTVTPEVPEETEAPAASEEPSIEIRVPENTPDPESAKPLTGGLLASDGTFEADTTPEPTVTPEPTEAIDETDEADSVETEVSEVIAKSAEEEEATEEPAPTETPEPELVVKTAGEATVYYNKNGRLYHMRSSCKNMKQAPAHTLAEALEAGKQKCNACGAPDPSLLEIEHVAWVDGNKVYHTTDECESFKGGWTLISLEDAVGADYTACPDCGAETYTSRFIEPEATPEPTEAPTEEPTEAPTEAPTEVPTEQPTEVPTAAPSETPAAETTEAPEKETAVEAESDNIEKADSQLEESTEAPEPTPEATEVPEQPKAVSPATPLKAAGDATVYHSSNGKFYHRYRICKNMTGSNPYKLSEITSAYRLCRTCNPPDTALVGQTCLWMDENDLAHTSDECEKFSGDYTLMLRDDALEQGKTGCPVCGADEYLIPNTTLVEPTIVGSEEVTEAE